MNYLPNPFDELGKRSTFEDPDLIIAAKSILEEIELPAFIADPSTEYLDALLEVAA